MNFKFLFIFLIVIMTALFMFTRHKSQQNQQQALAMQQHIEKQQRLWQEQQQREQHEKQVYEQEQQQKQQLRTQSVVINQPVQSYEQKRIDQQNRGYMRFCDMNKVFSEHLMRNYQYKNEILDTSQTTDLLEKEFIDEMLARMQQYPIAKSESEKQKQIQKFIEDEQPKCLSFFQNYGKRQFQEVPPPHSQ